MIPIPQGYSQVPLDYSGEIYLESQIKAHAYAVLLDCIKVAQSEAGEYSTDYYFWTVQNIINTIKQHYEIKDE